MPKSFDEARAARKNRDRDYLLGGETFTVVSGVRPEVLTEFDSITEDTPSGEVLRIVDALVLALTEDTNDGHARYRALREQTDDPITLEDLLELAQWLIEEQTGRPTEQPGPSSGGPGKTTGKLTAVS